MDKKTLRQSFRDKLSNLSNDRRQIASQAIYQRFKNQPGLILSFQSLSQELEMKNLNHLWAKEQRLVLPRTNYNKLKQSIGLDLYQVSDLDQDLQPHPIWKELSEPNPERTQPICPNELSLILVPGLAFDKLGGRLGQGAGYYDRFLASVPKDLKVIGVGFKEQLSDTLIPCESHDIFMDELELF